MLTSLGDTENDNFHTWLTILKIMKINKLEGANYNDKSFQVNFYEFDDTSMAESGMAYESGELIKQMLIDPICCSEISIFSDSCYKDYILKNINKEAIISYYGDIEEFIEDLIVISIETHEEKFNDDILTEFRKVVYSPGVDEYLKETLVYDDSNIIFIYDKYSCYYSLCNEDFIKLLWKYKKAGVLC